LLAELHGCAQRLPERLRSTLPVETFTRHQEMAARVVEAASSVTLMGKTQRELASFIRARQAVIERVLAAAQTLGRRARERKPLNVLCHADIHAANIIAAPDGRLWVIDWDGVMLAPPERDLFFWCDTPEWPLVAAGYEPIKGLDRELARYYQVEWVAQEIADYGENLFSSALSPEQKRDSLVEFITLFEPGNVIEAALTV
ncbi:MAG TPA: phosphotransferase, partial [Anaerolinea sp.]|nr:phosphotransferase [Anaerolinea sp.]